MSLLANSTIALAHAHKVEPRMADIIPLALPRGADRQGVLDWALAAVAEAEQRVAALHARIEYLEGLSVTDELTGLLNRRGFLAQLERALAFARRGGPHGALVMCDLDGFKQINDSAGHLAGDEVLCHVGMLLARNVRRADAVARLGGDEFAILLVGTPLEAARRKADGLHRLICATPVEIGSGQIGIAASFGLAPFTGTETEDELLNHADIAMYSQKRRRAANALKAAAPSA